MALTILEERRARHRRLVVIIVVAGVLGGCLLVLGAVRNHSLDDNTDLAVGELQSKWQNADLVAMNTAYNEALHESAETGDSSAFVAVFPAVHHADFSGGQFVKSGLVEANYTVHGWGGGTQCLSVVARTSPDARNKVTITRGGC